MLRTIVILISGVLVSSAALAADNGVYLGFGVSQSSVDFDYANASLDGNDTKFKVIAGVRPLDWLAFEINYVDFGSVETPSGTPTAAQAEYKLKGYDAFAMGLFEIGVVDFYAKAGGIRWNSSLDTVSTAIADADESGFDLAYGGGIQVHMGSLSVRGEYEKFAIGDNTDVSMVSLGLTWTFL